MKEEIREKTALEWIFGFELIPYSLETVSKCFEEQQQKVLNKESLRTYIFIFNQPEWQGSRGYLDHFRT